MVEQDDKLFKSFDSYDLSLGEVLRGERATLGKTREEVQKDLKIKTEFISAIEKCEVAGIENRSFIAGYVRTYARYLGLDPEYVYDRFCQESGFISSEVDPFSSKQKQLPSKKIVAGGVLDNHWTPGTLGTEANTRQMVVVNFMYKFFPLAALLLVLFGVGYWGTTIIQDLQRLEMVPIEQEPYKSVDLLGEIMGQGKQLNEVENYLGAVTEDGNWETTNFWHNYYASKEDLFPIVENRDSPIAKIDPNTHGLFLKEIDMAELEDATPKVDDPANVLSNYKYEPLVMISPKAPELKLIALERAWIRLRDEQGDIYLERNFKEGEELLIPEELFSGSLRAGNATQIYFKLNGDTFGPLSSSNSVVKNFLLDPLTIKKQLLLIKKEGDPFKSIREKNAQGLSTAKRNE